MTDRAQPGAIDSVIRNDELAEAISAFSEGAIVDGNNPTNASIRRNDIDETALDAFALSTSANSLDVTVAPGEGYAEGWFCRDVSTTITLPANATSNIVVGYNTDAIFDPQVDSDRDEADEAVVALQSNTDATIPQTVAHRVTTDGSGVVSADRVAPVGSLSLRGLDTPTVSGVERLTLDSGGVPPVIPNQPEINLPVTDNAAQGDQVEYNLSIDNEKGLTVKAEADGNGGIQDQSIVPDSPLRPQTDQYVHVDEFATLQDAIDFAESANPKKAVFLGTGEFDPVVTGTSLISTPRGLATDFSGPEIKGNGSGPLIKATVGDISIRGVAFNGNGNTDPAIKVDSSDTAEIYIRDCSFDDFGSSVIVLNGSGSPQITNCRFRTFNTGTDIVLGANTQKGVVDSCTPFKSPQNVSVSDSGTGNIIGDIS
jgi:hypothetical protein